MERPDLGLDHPLLGRRQIGLLGSTCVVTLIGGLGRPSGCTRGQEAGRPASHTSEPVPPIQELAHRTRFRPAVPA